MTPQVTLIARRGSTPVGELWSASSQEGATLTVEVFDPATPGVDTSRWEFLPRALHPALALPLPVGTTSGPAVALSPNIGRPALSATGLAGPLATLGAGIARGLHALHAAGLGHNAITPSLICTTPDGHAQLAVTAACALPLDVAGDLQGLRDALAALDPDAYTQINRDHDLGRPITAHDLADLLTAAALGTVAATLPADVIPGPPPPPPGTSPPGTAPLGPRLAPMPPPGGGIPSGGTPSGGIRPAAPRERRALPTRPLLIAGGIGVALVALAAIAGAATGGTTPTPVPNRTTVPTAAHAAPSHPTAASTTPTAASTTPAAAATSLAPAAIALPASPAPASSSPAASPHPTHTTVHATHTATAKPSRTPGVARTYAATASVAPRPSPAMTRPAPVITKPVPKPKATTAQPVVTGTVAPPH